MAFNIGVNVIEVDGRAAPTLVGAPTGVAGFLVRSQRGLPDVPELVRGLSDFTAAFGSYANDAFGAHAVRGFFENGGSEAWVVRVQSAATVAQHVFNDRAGAPTLRLTAGRRGHDDPGAWANALRLSIVDNPRARSAVPAQMIGTTTEPFALAAGQTLVVTVNGVTPAVTVTFAAADFTNIGAATAAEVAAAIRRQTPRVMAGATATQRVALASAVAGPASRLQVAGTAAATLGLAGSSDAGLAATAQTIQVESVGGFLPRAAVRLEWRGHVVAAGPVAAAVTDGAGIQVSVNGAAPVPIVLRAADFVGGAGAITAGEVVAAINRQARGRGFEAALDAQGRLVLRTALQPPTSPAVFGTPATGFGPGTSLAITAGAPDATAALGLTAAVPVAGGALNGTLDLVAERYRLLTLASAIGAPVVPNAARIVSAEFDLVVRRGTDELERFSSLSMQADLPYHVAAVVNDPAAGSRFVRATALPSPSGPVLDVPAAAADVAFATPGTDAATAPPDTAFIGDPAARTGLYAFDGVPIQLLACPDSTAAGVASAALSYCEARGDAMFVGAAPLGSDLEAIKAYAAPLRGRKVYGALYGPWIQVANPLDRDGVNPLLWVPPVGHVLGVYARTGDTRGVWKAPAGGEATLENALGVEFPMTDRDHTDLVKAGGVNGIRALPGEGIVVDASRTLSTDSRWLFVGTRRLFNYVKSTLRSGLRFVAQEPHTEELRRMVKFNVVTPFLLGLWRQGAFGSDPADQVFTVVCDETNNPPADVNTGRFTIEVYLYPVRPAETIIIVVGQQDAASSASER